MLGKLYEAKHYIYEEGKMYKTNPCDADAFWWLKPIGRALAWFSTECPCCSGTRVLLAAVAGAAFPALTLGVLGAALLALIIKECVLPSDWTE